MATADAKVKALRKALKSRDPFQDGDVILFERALSGRRYSYAALKAGGRWYVSGKASGTPMAFQYLLEVFLEDAERVRVVTETAEV